MMSFQIYVLYLIQCKDTIFQQLNKFQFIINDDSKYESSIILYIYIVDNKFINFQK